MHGRAIGERGSVIRRQMHGGKTEFFIRQKLLVGHSQRFGHEGLKSDVAIVKKFGVIKNPSVINIPEGHLLLESKCFRHLSATP